MPRCRHALAPTPFRYPPPHCRRTPPSGRLPSALMNRSPLTPPCRHALTPAPFTNAPPPPSLRSRRKPPLGRWPKTSRARCRGPCSWRRCGSGGGGEGAVWGEDEERVEKEGGRGVEGRAAGAHARGGGAAGQSGGEGGGGREGARCRSWTSLRTFSRARAPSFAPRIHGCIFSLFVLFPPTS